MVGGNRTLNHFDIIALELTNVDIDYVAISEKHFLDQDNLKEHGASYSLYCSCQPQRFTSVCAFN